MSMSGIKATKKQSNIAFLDHSGLLFTPEPYVYHVVSPVDSNSCPETNVILLYPPHLTHNRLNGGRGRVTFEDSEMLSNERWKIPSTRISVSLFLRMKSTTV
jgi:hypothetical protein